MKRVVVILITFSITAIAVLWLRGLLGVSPNFAGDGGPNLLAFFKVIALAAVSVLSALVGLVLLWRLVFLKTDSESSDREVETNKGTTSRRS